MPNMPMKNTGDDQSLPANRDSEAQQSDCADHASAEAPSPERPWYAEGLPFTCSQCGDCCSGAPGAVWVTDDELNAIASELGRPVGEIRLLHTKMIAGRWSLRDYPNGDCVFLDPKTRRCQVYGARPIQCRTWPFWPSNIATRGTWEDTCQICPGSGQGQLHSLEVIQRQADACDI